jgi:hypothetical protein
MIVKNNLSLNNLSYYIFPNYYILIALFVARVRELIAIKNIGFNLIPEFYFIAREKNYCNCF